MEKKKRIISYTRVSADIFHFGHLRLLQKAKDISDFHICGLYNDKLCRQWNGSLIMTYDERTAILEELECVDEVFEQDEMDPTSNLKKIHNRFPDSKIIFFQGHQKWEGLPGVNYVKSIAGEIVKPDYYSRITRSSIRQELNNAEEIKPYDIESYLLGDISYFTLHNSTKANTLASLKPNLKKSFIEKLFIFTKSQWEKSPEKILNIIKNKFNKEVVVRSSSQIEDSYVSSYAGFFHSELNINPQKTKQIKKAITKVLASYTKYDIVSKEDQILVQSQTQNVVYSGVIFTRNIQNNAPYYLINFDKSSSTDSVTSGRIGNKIEIIRNYKSKSLFPVWESLLKSIKEIEGLLHNLALDCEFAIKENGDIVIFQVRPIAANQKFKNIPEEKIYNTIQNLVIQYKNSSKLSIYNSSYTLSDMSFWNPAEIIGDRSDNLSYSIYRYLILSNAWNKGLTPLGYRKINRDLIVRFGNKSYIEVETAFAALLPNNLDIDISNKLIKYYQKKLVNQPELHDKIEFEIVHNCFSPITDDQLKDVKSILNKTEFKSFRTSLINLTQNIFDNYDNIKSNDLELLDELSRKRKQKIKTFASSQLHEKINIVIDLLKEARELGTPQFSRMARLAFIGNQYLKGLVLKEIITLDEYEKFLLSIDTIASELNKDFDRVISKEISVEEFNKIYGHLRPGTYDITKLPYFKDPDYFNINKSIKSNILDFTIKKKEVINIEKKITQYINDFEIRISSKQLLTFIKETTKYRESFKFEFTKNLSFALEYLADIGQELGFNREMLSHLSIESIKSLSTSGIAEIIDLWSSQIEGKKSRDQIYNYIALPSIIFNEEDFEIIQSYAAKPNFITNSLIRGELINMDTIRGEDYNLLSNRILLLEKADPGFDWVFSKGIKGLITRFGGAASHMAIRCAEFGIPSAIGCGEVIYKDIKDKQLIELDCKNKLISIIR